MMLGSAVVIVGALAEDAATRGGGIADDPVSFAIAGTLFVNGFNLIQPGLTKTEKLLKIPKGIPAIKKQRHILPREQKNGS
jgi:hypothetical protein